MWQKYLTFTCKNHERVHWCGTLKCHVMDNTEVEPTVRATGSKVCFMVCLWCFKLFPSIMSKCVCSVVFKWDDCLRKQHISCDLRRKKNHLVSCIWFLTTCSGSQKLLHFFLSIKTKTCNNCGGKCVSWNRLHNKIQTDLWGCKMDLMLSLRHCNEFVFLVCFVIFVFLLQIRPTWTGTPLCAYFLLALAMTWHDVYDGEEVQYTHNIL